MPKILVVRGGAIGDFILTLPVLSALKERFPDVSLEVLGYPHIASLAVESGLATGVRPIDARSLAGFFAAGGELDPDLRRYFAEFAIVVSFLYDPDDVFRANVARCSKAQFIVAPHRADDHAGIHATEVYLKALERLAIFNADATPRLTIGSMANSHQRRVIAAHPGSGSSLKNWPEERWALLLARIIDTTNHNLCLVGGEAEDGRIERLATRLPAQRVEVARSLPLPQVARRLQHCGLFVGHDSGISHLAAALGLPVIALWANSVEAVWRPRGERVTVLKESAGIAELEVSRVLEAIISSRQHAP